MAKPIKQLWAVWFRDHIHTDIEGKLAIFTTRAKAADWVYNHAVSPDDTKIRKLTLAD